MQEIGYAAGAGEEVGVGAEDAAGVGEGCAQFLGTGPKLLVVAA